MFVEGEGGGYGRIRRARARAVQFEQRHAMLR